MQAAAVETVHTVHDWLSEHPCFRCVCQRRTHSKLVRPQLQRVRQPVVCPYAGERMYFVRWPCDDERQRRHTAVSPDTRTNRRSRAECCRFLVKFWHLTFINCMIPLDHELVHRLQWITRYCQVSNGSSALSHRWM